MLMSSAETLSSNSSNDGRVDKARAMPIRWRCTPPASRRTARTAAPQERDEIWAQGVQIYPGLKKYEARAGDRHIEAFVLTRH